MSNVRFLHIAHNRGLSMEQLIANMEVRKVKAIKNLMILVRLHLLAMEYACCNRMLRKSRAKVCSHILQKAMHLRTKLGFAYQLGAKTVWIPCNFRKHMHTELDATTAETIHEIISRKRSEKSTQE